MYMYDVRFTSKKKVGRINRNNIREQQKVMIRDRKACAGRERGKEEKKVKCYIFVQRVQPPSTQLYFRMRTIKGRSAMKILG